MNFLSIFGLTLTLPSWLIGMVTILAHLHNYFSRRVIEYWKQHGIPIVELLPNQLKSYEDVEMDNYLTCGPIYGTMQGGIPILVVTDPKWIQQLMTNFLFSFRKKKNFDWFGKEVEADVTSFNFQDDPIRYQFLQTLTIDNLEKALSLIEDTAVNMIEQIKIMAESGQKIDFLNSFSSFTLNVITRCAREITMDSATGTTVHPSEVQRISDDRQEKTSPTTQRQKSKDTFLSIDGCNDIYPSPKTFLDGDSVFSQPAVVLLAGREMIITILSSVVLLLSKYPAVQDKLIAEIDELMKKNDGKLTYESISSMNYLEMIIDETLRLYPPYTKTERECKENNCEFKGISLKRGQSVVIPIRCIHYDEKYYPNPLFFDPERFSLDNKTKRDAYTYLPYGLEPMNNIVKTFLILEIKVVIAYVLSAFRLLKDDKDFSTSLTSNFYLPTTSVELFVEKRTL